MKIFFKFLTCNVQNALMEQIDSASSYSHHKISVWDDLSICIFYAESLHWSCRMDSVKTSKINSLVNSKWLDFPHREMYYLPLINIEILVTNPFTFPSFQWMFYSHRRLSSIYKSKCCVPICYTSCTFRSDICRCRVFLDSFYTSLRFPRPWFFAPRLDHGICRTDTTDARPLSRLDRSSYWWP